MIEDWIKNHKRMSWTTKIILAWIVDIIDLGLDILNFFTLGLLDKIIGYCEDDKND